jgi:hypothetical protein
MLPAAAENEPEAAWIVAAVFGADPKRHDVAGGPPGVHDFNLRCGHGSTVALEVTASTHSDRAEMWKAIRSGDATPPEIRRSWSISLQAPDAYSEGTRIREFMASAPAALAILEVECPDGSADLLDLRIQESLTAAAQDASARLRSLGARSANHLPPFGQPMLAMGMGGMQSPNNELNRTIERLALSNTEKLRRADASERHLFVWIDSETDWENNVALATYQVPSSPPLLPEGIDVVWAALWAGGANPECNAMALWRVVPPRGWEVLPVPAVRSYARRMRPETQSAAGNPR